MNVKYKKAPGQRLIKSMSLKQKSWTNAILGALLFSIGQCVVTLAWIRLDQDYHQPTWIFMVILGLVLSLGGLMVMGNALVFASQIKTKKFYKKRKTASVKKGIDNLENSKLKIERSPKN